MPSHSELAARYGLQDVLIFFHQNGYEISNYIFPFNDKICDYLHKHRLGYYNKRCYPVCERCYKEMTEALVDTWFLESSDYDSLHQWLPQEIVDDVLELSKISFNNSIIMPEDFIFYKDDIYR